MSLTQIYQVDAKAIQATLAKISEACQGVDPLTLYMSCLASAIMLQDEEIRGEKLRAAVLDMSKWLMEYMSGSSVEENLAKEQIN